MDKPKKETSQPLVPFWRHNWADLDRVFDNFRRDFEHTLASFPSLSMPSFPIATMSCDIVDEGDRYVINAEMPGVSKNEIKLNVSDNVVEISAEHKEQEEEKKKNYIRKESKAFSYHRTLPLPEKAKAGESKAKLNNGILTIEIPKIAPTPKPKSSSIPVQ